MTELGDAETLAGLATGIGAVSGIGAIMRTPGMPGASNTASGGADVVSGAGGGAGLSCACASSIIPVGGAPSATMKTVWKSRLRAERNLRRKMIPASLLVRDRAAAIGGVGANNSNDGPRPPPGFPVL
jgi:hypothetical protein